MAVARLQPERAGRNMNLLLPALDRADQDLCPCDAGQLHQCPARQRRIRRKLEFQQLDLAAEEGVGLDSRRNAQRPRHLRRADQLRIDGQAQPQIVGNERQLPRVFRVPDAGNVCFAPIFFATRQHSRFSSSCAVTAMTSSASSTPASSCVAYVAPFPSMLRMSRSSTVRCSGAPLPVDQW